MASGIEIPETPEVAAYYTYDKSVAHGQVRECHYYSSVEIRSAGALSILRPIMIPMFPSVTPCCICSMAWVRTSVDGAGKANGKHS